MALEKGRVTKVRALCETWWMCAFQHKHPPRKYIIPKQTPLDPRQQLSLSPWKLGSVLIFLHPKTKNEQGAGKADAQNPVHPAAAALRAGDHCSRLWRTQFTAAAADTIVSLLHSASRLHCWVLGVDLYPHCLPLYCRSHRQEFAEGLEQFRQLAGAFSQMQVPTALLKCVLSSCAWNKHTAQTLVPFSCCCVPLPPGSSTRAATQTTLCGRRFGQLSGTTR